LSGPDAGISERGWIRCPNAREFRDGSFLSRLQPLKTAAMDAFTTSPLLTDLYQINMIQAYLDHGDTDTAVFELFGRSLPPRRRFLLAAGLQQALDFLENLHFSSADIDWLKSTGRFNKNLLDYLGGFRFSGEVHAIAEGTAFFASEPILRVI